MTTGVIRWSIVWLAGLAWIVEEGYEEPADKLTLDNNKNEVYFNICRSIESTLAISVLKENIRQRKTLSHKSLSADIHTYNNEQKHPWQFVGSVAKTNPDKIIPSL